MKEKKKIYQEATAAVFGKRNCFPNKWFVVPITDHHLVLRVSKMRLREVTIMMISILSVTWRYSSGFATRSAFTRSSLTISKRSYSRSTLTMKLQTAIVGLPNVGKSTLFNRLVGDDLSVVHDMPGTTTDSVDTIVETEIGTLRFVDTAGMRRRANQSSGTEYYSMVRALKSIDRADVAILVVDGLEGVTHQDQRLAERIDAAGSPVVVVLNKWEELSAEEKVERGAEAEEKLAFLTYAPFIRISAKTGLATHRILPAVQNAIVAYRQRIPTRELNVAIAEFQSIHPPKGTKILYAVQGATDPPTFTLFSSRPIDNSYMRYLERKLRERFALGPTPIKMRVRRRSDG